MFSRGINPVGARTNESGASFIAADMTIVGDIETRGRLHLDGTIRGDLRCAVLSQGEGGAVHGNIVAEEVSLAGLVDGAVEAGALALEASARVTGDIVYESISIARGAEVEGRFRRRRPDDHGSIGARMEKKQEEPLELRLADIAPASAAVAAE